MWTFDEFKKEIVDKIKKRLGAEYRISPNTLSKINQGKKEGIQILKVNHTMSVQIYLEPFYLEYCQTENADAIVEDIIEEYQGCMEKNQKISIENPKKKITYRLINYQMNQGMLSKVPYLRCEDLAMVFYVVLESDQEEVKSFLLDYSLMGQWGMEEEEVLECAIVNTPQIFPAKIEALVQDLEKGNDAEPAFVFTNEQRIYGTGIIFYEHVLQDFAEKYGWNLFLLPVSVHEFLVMFDKEGVSAEGLHEMLCVANQTVVSKKDFLSDNIYYYDKDRKDFYAIY